MDIFHLLVPAFFAGVLTFLAPCTLPLVPGYLGFVSGVSTQELQDPSRTRSARKKIFLNGIFFTIGFSAIFIIFGVLAGILGQSLGIYRVWLSRIGGIFVILFGFFMLDIVKIPFLQSEKRLNAPSLFTRGKPLNSLILGAAFAFGWTPCVGPILGSILLLASTSGTIMQGALLLTVFSFGLAIPFLLIAAGISSASSFIEKAEPYLKIVSVIGGLFLIFLGILLLTDNFSLFIFWFYRTLNFIHYDRILNYL